MGFRKMGVCVVTGAILLGGLVGCGESARSKANAERNAQREAEMDGTAPSPSATPSFIPAISKKLVLLPGKVEIVPASSGGPMILKIVVEAKQKVAFGVVTRAAAGSYTTPGQVSSAMEKLKCANSGEGHLSLSCEITESEKDMVIVVADMRDAGRSVTDAFGTKKNDDASSYVNEVTVDLFVAMPAKK